MTVLSSISTLSYVGDGSRDTFPYTYQIWDKEWLRVSVDGTIKTVDTDYTVTDVEAESGGNIVFVDEPGHSEIPADGAIVTIEMNIPETQEAEFEVGGIAEVEKAFDKITLLVQQVHNRLTATDPGLVNSDYLGRLAADPSTTGWGAEEAGKWWFNTTTRKNRFWDGSQIVSYYTPGEFADYSLTLGLADLRTKGPWLDIKSLGAIANSYSGSIPSDNTSLINAGITSMSAVYGGILYLPPGVWYYNSDINVGVPITIQGSGKQTTFLRAMTNTQNGLNILTDSAVTIRDLTLDTSLTKTGGAGIVVNGTGVGTTYNSHSRFDNVIVNGHYQGIYFTRAAYWTMTCCAIAGYVLDGVTVRNLGTADAGDSQIIGCLFEGEGTSSGSAILLQSGGGLKITASKILGGTHGIHVNIIDGTTGILVCNGNSIENLSGYGGLFQRSAGAYSFSIIKLTGNEFADCASGSIAQSSSAFSDLSLIGNSFIGDLSGNHVYLDGMARGLISGNYFYGGSGTTDIYLTSNTSNLKIGPNQHIGSGVRINDLSSSTIYDVMDRGDTTTYDWTITDLVLDGNWHTLDCSTKVPQGTRLIQFKVSLSADAAGLYFRLTKNGAAATTINSLALGSIVDTHEDSSVHGQPVYGYASIPCDENLCVQYKGDVSASWTSVGILVMNTRGI